MTEKQRTFGEIVGMEPVVPTAPHGDDIVTCSDGSECLRHDVFTDCRDNPHHTEEECRDANVAIVTEILNDRVRWSEEYVTENTDYPNGYAYVVDEMGYPGLKDSIDDWVCEHYGDLPDDLHKFVCEHLFERIDSDESEPEFCASEYCSYSGKGICIGSLDIGELEEQVSISDYPELQTLHDEGVLDDILDGVDCDGYIRRVQGRRRNEETGIYEYYGRETYNHYGSKHPDIMVYTYPGGQWFYVVSDERLNDLARDAFGEYAYNGDHPCPPVFEAGDKWYARDDGDAYDYPIDAVVAWCENGGITGWEDIAELDYCIECMDHAEFDNWQDVVADYVDFDEGSDDDRKFRLWRSTGSIDGEGADG